MIAAGLIGLGFGIGLLAGGMNPAVASTPTASVLVKERMQVPTLAIPKDGVGIIGASDDLYYIVRADGTTAVLTGMRREDLCWRRPDER